MKTGNTTLALLQVFSMDDHHGRLGPMSIKWGRIRNFFVVYPLQLSIPLAHRNCVPKSMSALIVQGTGMSPGQDGWPDFRENDAPEAVAI
jgi:hypothetical protein